MFIEPECSNCAWSFLLWSLIPSKAGLANTPTVGYLGRVLGAITPKNQNTQNTNTRSITPPPPKKKKKPKKQENTTTQTRGLVAVPWVCFGGGLDNLPQKSEYKYSPPPKKNKHKKHNRINPKTRIGCCSLGSLQWGVRRFATKKGI